MSINLAESRGDFRQKKMKGDSSMKNCWEIKKCGRETGGPKSKELGVCVAAREELGHSCWMIAGTLCGGAVQGSVA
ncbi:hypothetical protein AUK22_10000 [bacterium CG2_30_54_10]|nr:MAG: hypothetical protein AUK22_10000 [bacterium CG2_30_54_10]